MNWIVIIPALNPDEGLRELVDRNWELENQVIVVNDGSEESYDRFFWELEEKCIVLRHGENRGKGAAIKTALKYIKNEIWECGVIGIMDADGQHLPEDMEKLLMRAAVKPGTLILGSRAIDERAPWASRMGNRITRKVFRAVTGTEVTDTQSGLRAFSTDLLDFMLDIPGERYEYEMNVLTACVRQEIPVTEVPVQAIYHDEKNSCSHFRKVRDSVRIYAQLLKFSLISLSSFVLDYGLFVFLTLLFPKTEGFVLAANIMARLGSGVYNYLMNCRLVFQEGRSAKTALNYLALAGAVLLINNLLLQGFLAFLHMAVYPAKLLTECTLFALSWLVQKRVIFREAGKAYV